MHTNIDVIIPSFRLDEKYILPVLQMKRPDEIGVRFYLVCDNPGVKISSSIKSLVDEKNIFLFINEKNFGAAMTRNKGINVSEKEWILFLDDDILVENNLLEIYADAIKKNPNETGFIGLIDLPKPVTNFSKAIIASDAMNIFSIAKQKEFFSWGATANILVKRSAVKDIRFCERYPKQGGGEDVDFFLQVRRQNNYQNYKCLPQAAVLHGWWRNGKADFSKPFRYGVGNSLLPQLNPQYAYRDFLNTAETIFVLIVSSLLIAIIQPKYILPSLFFLTGIIIIDIIAGIIKMLKEKNKMNLQTFGYTILMSFVHECGLLWGNISRGNLAGLGKRFNMDGSLKKRHFYRTNTRKIVKWILYPLLAYFLWKFFLMNKPV